MPYVQSVRKQYRTLLFLNLDRAKVHATVVWVSCSQRQYNFHHLLLLIFFINLDCFSYSVICSISVVPYISGIQIPEILMFKMMKIHVLQLNYTWAEFVMNIVCYGPRCPGTSASTESSVDRYIPSFFLLYFLLKALSQFLTRLIRHKKRYLKSALRENWGQFQSIHVQQQTSKLERMYHRIGNCILQNQAGKDGTINRSLNFSIPGFFIILELNGFCRHISYRVVLKMHV